MTEHIASATVTPEQDVSPIAELRAPLREIQNACHSGGNSTRTTKAYARTQWEVLENLMLELERWRDRCPYVDFNGLHLAKGWLVRPRMYWAIWPACKLCAKMLHACDALGTTLDAIEEAYR